MGDKYNIQTMQCDLKINLYQKTRNPKQRYIRVAHMTVTSTR